MFSSNRPVSGRSLIAGALICSISLPASAVAVRTQPLRFFEGRTEMLSVVKVIMKKPYRSRTLGAGRILPDGSLALIQQVYDEGQAPEQRRWNVRQLGPGHFAGTMTDAVGPVVVDEMGGRYRFKFRMKGNLAIEQWVTPLPGGTSARTNLTVRKLGMQVASSVGTIRRV
ncbi:MAG TPA: hypothetical protein VF067_00025 [Sphingomicrobium sp.]